MWWDVSSDGEKVGNSEIFEKWNWKDGIGKWNLLSALLSDHKSCVSNRAKSSQSGPNRKDFRNSNALIFRHTNASLE